jgi:hypothetical protein
MNHGGLGYLGVDEEVSSLWVPPELLEQSFVRRGGRMYGVYYNPPRDRADYRAVRTGYDLMLTVIPYRFWPRAARLTIRMWHKPGTLRQISRYLAQRHVTILQSESTRSGYRYETWSFYLAFEDLGTDLTFDPKRSVYVETFDRLCEIADQLRRDCASALFADPNDEDLRSPVIPFLNTALAYFYNYAESRRVADDPDAWTHRCFELECTGPGTLASRDGHLTSILRSLSRGQLDGEMPAVLFAGMDTRYLNIRMSVVPPPVLLSLFELVVEYERNEPGSCAGLIASVTEGFPAEYNVWSSYNRTALNHEQYESGRMVFVIEDQNAEGLSALEVEEKARGILGNLSTWETFRARAGMRFGEPMLRSVTPLRVRRKLRQVARERGAYDVFISYSSRDAEHAKRVAAALKSEGLEYFMAEGAIEGGDQIDTAVLSALKDSHEMCVLCTPNSMKNRWVFTEVGAGWAMDKRIVPITYGVEVKTLPAPLSRALAIDYESRQAYATETRIRIDESLMG